MAGAIARRNGADPLLDNTASINQLSKIRLPYTGASGHTELRVSTRRCRSTWLTALAGSDLDVLTVRRLARVNNLGSLDRYLGFADTPTPVPPTELVARLAEATSLGGGS